MGWRYSLSDGINLHVPGRIAREDADRQIATAKEILCRLREQPGVILADEVGMGKTFVGLAVATSVAHSDPGGRPCVVMVPSALKDKWPREFKTFREKCFGRRAPDALTATSAERAGQFFKLIDNPRAKRPGLIFLTHGAMNRALGDGWIRLALIQQALHGRRGASNVRRALSRCMGRLLQMTWVDRSDPDVWARLMDHDPREWLRILRRAEIDPENDDSAETDDDPVPRALIDVIHELDTDDLFEALCRVPRRRGEFYEFDVDCARREMADEVQSLWEQALSRMRFRLPLLVLDEAHHLKNARTRLAGLFASDEAAGDVEQLAGPLSGKFERMLFLTATPFQLGHGELCSVLERFGAVAWTGRSAPRMGADGFRKRVQDLRESLDRAQGNALRLDAAWGKLNCGSCGLTTDREDEVMRWWDKRDGGTDELAKKNARECYEATARAMREAEVLLRPWVIRHNRPKHLPRPYHRSLRRLRRVGQAIIPDRNGAQMGGQSSGVGIVVDNHALVPFLLAARATALTPESRPVFAEGLASSYEAFLLTRRAAVGRRESLASGCVDVDDDLALPDHVGADVRWYLDRLESLLPASDSAAGRAHPKISATVDRVVDSWLRREKVLVFCHYLATGRALRDHISAAIREEMLRIGQKKLSVSRGDVFRTLERLGKRFFDADSPVRRSCEAETRQMLKKFNALGQFHDDLVAMVRRYLRTPPFLLRYFSLQGGQLGKRAVQDALDARDAAGTSLRALLMSFFDFLSQRIEICRDLIAATSELRVGSYGTLRVDLDPSERHAERRTTSLASVRLVNGQVQQATRQRLMATFNTPFFPEILIASSVLAEGVDLHLACRQVIHHDLCWNPSTLEQRTGRVDRIGAKAERSGSPIDVYLPFVAETQDEKMFRVVTDRERWFRVVMGDQYDCSHRSTEKLADRVPFPSKLAEGLAFRLEVRTGD